MRVLRELFNPQLKCKRVGHSDKVVTKKIRRECHEGRIVVRDYMADITTCRRCGRKKSPENEHELAYFHSCSMPDFMWDAMRKNGYVIMQ